MDKFTENLPSPQDLWGIYREYIPTIVLGVGGTWIVFKIGETVLQTVSRKRMLARWETTPKNVVILHAFGAGKTTPNPSPFIVKLETYMRMTNIPYEIDVKDPMSVKGKSPWITYNGEHIADSQLCIEFLAKKLKKTVGNYPPEKKAVGTMARITMDEHFYWGLVLWRYVYTKGRDCHKIFGKTPLVLKLMIFIFRGKLKQVAWGQGIGRHTQEECIGIMIEDLKALSLLIGKNKFLLGNEPCEDDAAVFGQLSQILWSCPDSPFEEFIRNDEVLKSYCIRMKEAFWPDWDDCLAGGKRSSKKNN